MSFLHPQLLWAAPLAALPLIAHLLSPKSLRVVPFAPIAWLRPTAARAQGKHALQGLVLLALRMLGLLAAVLLCAHPADEAPAAQAFGAAVPSHGVLVVDASLSMNYRNQKGTLLAAAKAMAQAQVARDPVDKAWALVVLGGAQSRSQPFTTDAQTVVQAIAHHVPSQGSGTADLAQGIEQAMRLLEHAHVQGNIVVISDLSRSSLPRGMPVAFGASQSDGNLPPISWLDAAARPLGPGGELTQLSNLAITDMRVRPGAGVEVSVHNYGPQPVEGRGLTLSMEGGASLRGLLTVPAGATITKLLALGVGHCGPGVIEARLDAADVAQDGFAADDQLRRTLMFAPPIRVLAVDGAPHSRARSSELYYGERALLEAPKEQGATAVTVVPRSELLPALTGPQAAQAWDVILLANVGRVTAEEGQALARLRGSGVGLVVGMGDAFVFEGDRDAQAYRAFVPLELRDVAQRSEHPAVFSALALSHPILRNLGEAAVASMRRVRTQRYIFVATQAAQSSAVVAAFDDGAPALIEVPAEGGRGAVVLWTSSLDADWTTLPLMGVYVPFLQRLVVHAAQRSAPSEAAAPDDEAGREALSESDFWPVTRAVLAQGQASLGQQGQAAAAAARSSGAARAMLLASGVWLLVLAEMGVMVCIRRAARYREYAANTLPASG